jgi:hypothetical protein
MALIDYLVIGTVFVVVGGVFLYKKMKKETPEFLPTEQPKPEKPVEQPKPDVTGAAIVMGPDGRLTTNGANPVLDSYFASAQPRPTDPTWHGQGNTPDLLSVFVTPAHNTAAAIARQHLEQKIRTGEPYFTTDFDKCEFTSDLQEAAWFAQVRARMVK